MKCEELDLTSGFFFFSILPCSQQGLSAAEGTGPCREWTTHVPLSLVWQIYATSGIKYKNV
jgi:hypothetical protein